MPVDQSAKQPTADLRLGVALIGFGRRANEHLDSLLKFNTPVEVRAVCDPDPVARARAQRKLPSAKIGSDVGSTLSGVRCDLAVICLPPNASRDFVGELPRFGVKAILVEKPAAMDSESARRMLDAVSVPVYVFHQMRLLPWLDEISDWLREALESDPPVHIEATCYGKLHDQGLHLIDLVSCLFDVLPEKIDRVVVEDDPARISSRKPLPADWRIDHHHPGPLAVEIEASRGNGNTFRIQCGPFASGGWLEKRLTIRAGNRTACFGTNGAVFENDGEVEIEVSGEGDDYLRATALVYLEFHRWLVKGGDAPGVTSLAEQIEQLSWCESALGKPDPERFEVPSWMSSNRSNLPLLVVIPLSDHRGVAELCIRSWTDGQTADPEVFQLVLISNQETKELGISLRQFLRPHDVVVETGLPQAEMGQGDMEEYVRGIESGASEWIFLTEPHCEAPPEAISQLIRFFETSESAGFCTECIDKVESPWGAMEALYSEEGFEVWREPGNWSKMIMRGFGIRRTAYEGAGGFRLRYGRFSEWLLAADLHRRGFYLDCAEAVRVIHHYTPDKSYLDEAIEEFVVGQAKYLAEIPEQERLPYFYSPSFEIPLSGDLERLFGRLNGKLRKLGIRTSPGLHLPIASRLWIRREWNALVVRIFAPWAPHFAYPFFKRYYESQNARCLLVNYAHFLSEQERLPLEVGRRIEADETEFEAVVQMNQLEIWNQIGFRWSKPNFAIRLRIEPGDRVLLYLGVVAGIIEVDPQRVVALVDLPGAEPIFPETGVVESSLVFDLSALQEPFSGWIAIACEETDAPGDERSLGLPLRSVSLQTE